MVVRPDLESCKKSTVRSDAAGAMALSELDAKLEKNTKWKYLTEFIGQGSISGGVNLPDDFNELMIIGNGLDMHIIRDVLSNSAEYHSIGWYFTSDNNGGITIQLSKTRINYANAWYHGTYKSDTLFKVYYK